MSTLMLTPRDLMTAASTGDVQGVRDGISWFLEIPNEMHPIQEAIEHLLHAVQRCPETGRRAEVLESLVDAISAGVKRPPDRQFLMQCLFGPSALHFYAQLWSRLLFKATDIAAGMGIGQAKVQPLVQPARSVRVWFETVNEEEWRGHGWFGQSLEDLRELLIGLTSFLAAMGPGQAKLDAVEALASMIGELGRAPEPDQAISVLRWIVNRVGESSCGEAEHRGSGFERFLAQQLHLERFPSVLRLEEILVAGLPAPADPAVEAPSRHIPGAVRQR